MNKVGVFYVYWERSFQADADLFIRNIKRAAGLGFDVVEVFAPTFYDMSRSDMDRIKDTLKETGMEILYAFAFSADNDISAVDGSTRKRGIEYMQQIMKNVNYVSGATGIAGITFGAWHGPLEDSREAHWDRAVGSVKEIAKTAEEYSITYSLETVNRFESFLLNTHQDSLKFAREVDSPNVKVHLDTFHMNIEEDDMATAIINTGDMIGHFHTGENNRRPPGTGNLDWDAVFSALARANYQGAIVTEPFVLSGGDVSTNVGLYRDLMAEADLDTEAMKSLNFMREKIRKFSV